MAQVHDASPMLNLRKFPVALRYAALILAVLAPLLACVRGVGSASGSLDLARATTPAPAAVSDVQRCETDPTIDDTDDSLAALAEAVDLLLPLHAQSDVATFSRSHHGGYSKLSPSRGPPAA